MSFATEQAALCSTALVLVVDFDLDPLPPGITCGARPDGERVDLTAFKAAAHYAARAAGGTVSRFDLDRPYTSYAHAVLDLPGSAVAVLCNRAYPAVAFSDEPDGLYLTRSYVDIPKLAAAFTEASFQPVPLSVSTAAPSTLSLDALSKAERAHVRYWIRYGRLSQAGDVIFNDWD